MILNAGTASVPLQVMLVLCDQGTPVGIRNFLQGHVVKTAYEQGRSTLLNAVKRALPVHPISAAGVRSAFNLEIAGEVHYELSEKVHFRSRVSVSSSSGVLGQSSRSRRDKARSARSLPPVWHVGQ